MEAGSQMDIVSVVWKTPVNNLFQCGPELVTLSPETYPILAKGITFITGLKILR